MAQDQEPFHIIIAGGGLVGLSAAHIFDSLAAELAAVPGARKVKFTVLEAHDTVTPFIGSLLLLYPPSFRIYDQLGLLSAINGVVDDIDKTVTFTAETGAVRYVDESLAELVQRRHGHQFKVLHRPRLAECLYHGLSDEARANVLLGKRVMNVKTDGGAGVEVICQDGTVIKGDILIGADGVRSRVRSNMQRLKAASDGREAKDQKPSTNESPYIASYRLLFGNVPVLEGLPIGVNWEGAGDGISTQILTGSKQAWWALYEQLPEPTSKHSKYDEEDKARVIARWGDVYMAPGYKLRDVLEHNSGAIGLINLEEGMVEEWTWDRVVLVGDAVRKVEPHAGLGFNQGLTDIVTLANKLHGLLLEKPDPRTGDLAAVFGEYQAERHETLHTIDRMSRRRARQVGWPNGGYRWFATWVLPYAPLARVGLEYVMGPIMARAPVAAWLRETSLPAHEVEYETYGAADDEKKRARTRKAVAVRAQGSGSYGLTLGTATILLAGLTAVGLRYYRRI
ncbi:uncharacterized protein JN550_013857 [Neoarthrinium moseri]|uniref:uncharacterized protein n=1 Tax=Neoarthrinium moseri TaxID=1658444 RepID=UPI001FDD5B27|nr:uncharacterized protein JN550_013857 [Neoarthrinium moseri]KAI1856316.1 hypothetical protein JN550_013857 [Neoarthrinium moseri]